MPQTSCTDRALAHTRPVAMERLARCRERQYLSPMLTHEGPSRPSTHAAGPPALAALLAERGPGRLARQLDLDPGEALRAELDSRDVVGWWPLRAAGAEPLGRFTSGRAYLVHAPTLSPGLFIAHVCGMVVSVGSDLDALDACLTRGVAIDLEMRICERILSLYAVPLTGLKDAAIDGLGDAFGIDATYDTDAGAAEGRFAHALEQGSEAERDEALAAFLASGTSIDVLPRAAAIALAAGERGADVADTVHAIRKRRPFLDELLDRIARATPLLDGSRGALLALGLTGRALPRADVGMAAAASFTPTVMVIRDALDAARVEGLFDAPHFPEALSACSPEDAHACAAMARGTSALDRTRGGSPPLDGFDDRHWPLLLSLALVPGRHPLWAVLSAFHDPRMAPALETYLLRPASVHFQSEPQPTAMLDSSDAAAAAALRARLGPIGDDVVARARLTLTHDGGPPKTYTRYQATGAFELLSHAKHDSALALIEEHATRNPYLAVTAAQRAGDRPAARALLHRIWSEPKRYTTQPALAAAQLAASFGDARAKAAIAALDKANESHMRRYRNM